MASIVESIDNKLDLLYKQKIQLSCELNKCNHDIDELIKEKQTYCKHEWVTEIRPYERDVYCCKCKLTDWDRSKF